MNESRRPGSDSRFRSRRARTRLEEGPNTGYLITVCTFRRPEQLDRTLKSLRVEMDSVDEKVELLVVDNDPEGSAQDTATRNGVQYLSEPRSGVGNARNAALATLATREPVAGLLFFDDDQVPVRGWLAAFLDAHRQHPYDVLSGPVQPRLDFPIPEWAGDGWPWTRPLRQDHEVLKMTGDGNVLIPYSVLTRTECRYSPQFAMGMGQDTDLFFRLRRLGVEIRNVAGASAIEDVLEDRRTLEWLETRAALAADAWARVVILNGRLPRLRIGLAIYRRKWLLHSKRETNDARRRILAVELDALRGRLHGRSGLSQD